MVNSYRIFNFSTSTEPLGRTGHANVGQKTLGALNFTKKIKNAAKGVVFNIFLSFQLQWKLEPLALACPLWLCWG